MVGLGETRAELSRTLSDIRATGCSLVTVGQYLRPTREQLEVVRYYEPAEFDEIAEEARAIGFRDVAAGPLVRSSYRADRLWAAVHPDV
jgi:lipoic acid synthetase